jgi:hypothetical protein
MAVLPSVRAVFIKLKTMDIRQLAIKLERLGVAARLHDVAFFMKEGECSRIQRFHSVLDHLDRGVYLVGTGP